MSLLLQRAKRERLRWDENPRIGSPRPQPITKASVPVAAIPQAKTATGFWNRYFTWPKKSRATNKEPLFENTQASIKNTSTRETLNPAEIPSSGDDIIDQLNNDGLSPQLTVSPGLLNEQRRGSPGSNASSPEEKHRQSMDFDDSREMSQAGSSISNVSTNASTAPSAREKPSPTEIVHDMVPTRLFHDRRNRLEGPEVDLAIVLEKSSASNTKHLADGSDEVQEVESTGAAMVEQSNNTMPDEETKALDVEKPLMGSESNVSDSTKSGAILATAEILDSTRQVVKKPYRGKRLRKTGGAKKASNYRRSVQRRINVAAADVREDVELEITTLQNVISGLRRDNKALSVQSNKNYKEWQEVKYRIADYNFDLENDDPDTVAEANNVTKQLQEKNQLLEETNKQQMMDLHREYDDYVHSHQGEVDLVRTKLHEAQEELTYAEQCKDDYKQQLDDALSRLGQYVRDQQIISAFQSKEATLIQEKENLLQLFEGETKKLNEVERSATELRLNCRDAERKLEDAQDQIAQLISAKELLEARAEPIDFLGLPSGQRDEMARKDQKLVETADELRCANETIASIVNVNGDEITAALMDSHAHKVNMLTVIIQSNNDEISELRQKLSFQSHAQERDQYFAVHMEEDMQELQIQYNAASKDLRTLREQLANGNHTLADPKSWQHMKECSEGREQAILLQEKAEKQLEGYKRQYEEYQDHAIELWRRICGFEELRAPSDCPDYLTEDRDELAARTLELWNLDVNDVDLQKQADAVAEDKQKFGCYRGPHGTPANWLPGAQMQAAAGSSAQASLGGSDSSHVAQGSASGGPVTGVTDQADTEPEWTMSPAVQQHIDELSYYSDKRQELIICLWAQIWEFENIVTPEECEERVWHGRIDLVKQTEELTEFQVNAIFPESEALVTGDHGPLHTPDHWMPEETSDEAPETLKPTKASETTTQISSAAMTTIPSIVCTDHGTPSNPLTVASSSDTPLFELDVRAKIMADNYANPEQVINDHILAEYLAAHPELLDNEEISSEQLTSRHVYLHIDPSAKKNKAKQTIRSKSNSSEENVWQQRTDLQEAGLAAMFAGLKRGAEYEGATEQTLFGKRNDGVESGEGDEKMVRWADDVAAGLVGMDVGLEQVGYFRAADAPVELEEQVWREEQKEGQKEGKKDEKTQTPKLQKKSKKQQKKKKQNKKL